MVGYTITKYFFFKTKSIIARYEYINSLKIPSTVGSQNYFDSVEITKYLLSKCKSSVEGHFKHSS